MSYLPDEAFLKALSFYDFLFDEALQIAPIRILHDNGQDIAALLKKCPLILDDVGGIDGSQQPDFIQCIVLFLGAELHELDGLHGKHTQIILLPDLEHPAEAA